MTRYANTAFALALLVAGACSDRIIEDEPYTDPDAPKITITSPVRGTHLPDYQIEVAGRVSDDDSEVASVEINGSPVFVSDDGSFRHLLNVGDGMTLIQTRATDRDGNVGTDTRAVMAGNLVPLDTPSADGIVGRIGRPTFDNINITVENWLESPEEFEKIAERINPVFNAGGYDGGDDCLGVEMDVGRVDIDDAEFELLPYGPDGDYYGGLMFSARLHNPKLQFPTRWSLACLDGDTNVNVTADLATVAGRIEIHMDRGELVIETASVNSTFENLYVQAGILNSGIIETFFDDIDGLAGDAVEGLVKSQVNSFINSFLTPYLTGDETVGSTEHRLVVAAIPTMVEFNDDGAFMAADTLVTPEVTRDHAGYIATPSEQPVIDAMDYAGFRGMVADDFLNQAFASLWATGAIENAVILDAGMEDKTSFIGKNIDRIEVNAMLPPYVDARDLDGVRLSIGDVLINFINEGPGGDEVITSLALSMAVDISVTVDGDNKLSLATIHPDTWVDVLDESDGVTGANPFNRDDIEVLASFVTAALVSSADDFIRNIPIPNIAGTTIESAEVAADRGYIVLGGELRLPQ